MARATIGETVKRGMRIVVHTTYAEKDMIRAVPGAKWDDYEKAWTFPISWATVVQLRGMFGERLESSQELADWAWSEYNRRVAPSMAIRDALAAEGDSTWRPYQLADINWLLVAEDALLGNEPGTGKTVSTLTAARAIHYHRNTALPMLIICPNTVKRHWERHFDKWFPEATPYVLVGGAVKRRKILEEAAADPMAAVIINIEAVRLHTRLGAYGSIRLARCENCFSKEDWRNLSAAEKFADEQEALGLPRPALTVPTPVKESGCEVHLKELNHMTFKTVVLDEAHRTKEPTSKQTRACWYLQHSEGVEQRWSLTGTPIANHVGDLWSIMHGIAPHEYAARAEFVDRYAQFAWNEYGTQDISDVRPDTREELFKFLDPRFRRMLSAVVLPQLPPKIWSTYEVELTPKQRKMYDEIEEMLFARDEKGNMLVATNNLVKNTRLIQLASSSCEVVYTGELDDHGNEKFEINLINPSSKIDALVEVVGDFEGHSIAVSAFSRKLIDLAEQRLTDKGIRCVKITGGVNEWDRAENLRKFQNKEAQVMLFTLSAGGVGIDMTTASVMVRLQRSYSMIDNVQGLGRVHRIGSEQHSSIFIVDIIAPGTVEDDQLDRLRVKEERLETITRDIASLAANGLPTEQLVLEYQAISNSHLTEEG